MYTIGMKLTPKSKTVQYINELTDKSQLVHNTGFRDGGIKSIVIQDVEQAYRVRRYLELNWSFRGHEFLVLPLAGLVNTMPTNFHVLNGQKVNRYGRPLEDRAAK